MQLEQNASHLFEDSWNYMGFDLKDTGFHIILDRGIPGAVDKQIAPVLKSFVSGAGLQPADLGFYCIHPGGRRALMKSKRHLNSKKKMLPRHVLVLLKSAISVACVGSFEEPFERFRPEHEAKGLLAAFGPGFSAEMSLGTRYERLRRRTLQWYFVFRGIVAFSRIAKSFMLKGSAKSRARGDKPEKEKILSPWSHSTPCFLWHRYEVLWQ